MTAVDLAEDHHVHSDFSDDAVSTLAENVAAAAAAGLTSFTALDHVRSTTTWVPDLVAAVAALDLPDGLGVRVGVETKLLSTAGDLDLPPEAVVGPGALDVIVVGDHQMPGPDGPWSPSRTKELLASGTTPEEIVEQLVAASVAMMEAHPGVQLAHWFSILPKVGLCEDDLTDAQLLRWARTAHATGCAVEVNEKWACPEPRTVAAALDAGVRLVASTDSHDARDVGRYARVRDILARADRLGAAAHAVSQAAAGSPSAGTGEGHA